MTTFAFVAGMIPLVALERRRLGDQPRDRVRHHRRSVAGAAADARRHAGRLLAVRRRVEDAGCRRWRRAARPAAATATLLALLLVPIAASAQPITDDAAAGRTGHRHRRGRQADPGRRGPDGAREQPRPGGDAVRSGHQRRRVAAARAVFRPTFTTACSATAADAADQPLLGRSRQPDRRLVRRRRARAVAALGRRVLRRVVRIGSARRPTTRSPASPRRCARRFQAIFSQPLLRDFKIDAAGRRSRSRSATATSPTSGPGTVGADRRQRGGAYWALVAARASVEVQQRSLDLALELERTNRARVDVGQSPPLDLVAARAEVAQRRENLIVARTTARQAEDLLRTLIVDPKRATTGALRLDPAERVPPCRGRRTSTRRSAAR